jgi:hypothetical protein
MSRGSSLKDEAGSDISRVAFLRNLGSFLIKSLLRMGVDSESLFKLLSVDAAEWLTKRRDTQGALFLLDVTKKYRSMRRYSCLTERVFGHPSRSQCHPVRRPDENAGAGCHDRRSRRPSQPTAGGGRSAGSARRHPGAPHGDPDSVEIYISRRIGGRSDQFGGDCVRNDHLAAEALKEFAAATPAIYGTAC